MSTTILNVDSESRTVLRECLEEMNADPIGDAAVTLSMSFLSRLQLSVQRLDRIGSQGRVSFGRKWSYCDGLAVYLGPDRKPKFEQASYRPTFDKTRSAAPTDAEYGSAEKAAEAFREIVGELLERGVEPAKLTHPALAVLCHSAAARGATVQIRRGVRAEGRIPFDAAGHNTPHRALFVPKIRMLRGDTTKPVESHIEEAYGRAPKHPQVARELPGTHTADPERV